MGFKNIKKILFVQMELAIDPLYKKELNYINMINYMKKEDL